MDWTIRIQVSHAVAIEIRRNLTPSGKELHMADPFEVELDRRLKFLDNVIKEKTAALANAPDGRLRCTSRGGKAQYYWCKDSRSISGSYIPLACRDFAASLAQKSYDRAILDYALEEKRRIEQLSKTRSLHSIESVYSNYGASRKALVDPVWLPDDEYIENWLRQEYKNKNGFKEGAPMFFTKRNERMRSKTEIIISDILTDLSIPYLYEFPIYLRGKGWVFPDFMVLNVRLRLVRYWEHLGKMSDPEYCAENLDKILHYERNGIFPGTDLIITHETAENPVDTRLLVQIAKHYCL